MERGEAALRGRKADAPGAAELEGGDARAEVGDDVLAVLAGAAAAAGAEGFGVEGEALGGALDGS